MVYMGPVNVSPVPGTSQMTDWSTVNWYRNREQNYEDELQLKTFGIEVPVLFIQATRDAALPPSMSAGMEEKLPNLTRKEVDASHWALWQAPDKVNSFIREWLETVAFGGKSTL